MPNDEQAIQFPIALKPLLTDFVVNVLRDRIPSDQLSSYAVRYFTEKQNIKSSVSAKEDNGNEIGIFLTNQTSRTSHQNEDGISKEKQRRKSVWGGSPV